MGKATGFLDYNRVDAGHRSPEERLRDWNEFIVPLDADKQREQGIAVYELRCAVLPRGRTMGTCSIRMSEQ